MSQINHIRELAKSGYRNCEITEKTGADVKTVKKYLAIEDFSPKAPLKTSLPSKLDAYKVQICEWLLEDEKNWRKQRHSAKRIHKRLVEETDFNGSYSIVQRYVRAVRQERKERANLELVWDAGTAQVDFGEADFYECGEKKRRKFLSVSFPYSNDGYTQIFGGETAECVCQGLQDIFSYIEGVPKLLIFDNATGVGRRTYDKIKETELFSLFKAHYGCSVRYCNKESGWEKGNVERKVYYQRANLFVPVPQYEDINAYNETLLVRHEEKAAEIHYKKNILISELFKEDQNALMPLPSKPFNVCRYEWVKADGYGKICLDGKHYYSTKPENAGKKVLLGIRAHTVEILSDNGEIITVHKRQYGDIRTDSSDHKTTLSVLLRNTGAWHNSGLRQQVGDILRDYLDNMPRPELRDCLKIMKELTNQYGFEAAMSAMDMAAGRGRINICDASVLAARITGYGIKTPPESGPPLSIYDEAFLPKGGEDVC